MALLTFILICVGSFAILHFYKRFIRNKKAKEKLVALLPAIETAAGQYQLLTNYDNYFSNYQEQHYLQTNEKAFNAVPSYYNKLGLPKKDSDLLTMFLINYKNTASNRVAYNNLFVRAEAEKYAHLFYNLEKYPLSKDQIEAIIRDEDNNLVIAGAGTGKTTTISAKVAYLLTKGLAKPEDLLIISFTKNAVNEMYKRCTEFCSTIPGKENLEVRTFNSFGYYVTRLCSDHEMLLAFDGKDDPAKEFLQKTFSELFISDPDFQRKAINFIAFFSRPERDEFEFESKNDFIQNENGFENITLDGKTVNSKEELEIGNFLCLYKIEYEYQKHYPLKPEDRNANYAAYQPDFYFPEYQIWHEHFGIDRNGDVPQWFATKHPHKSARETYHAGILWKEEIHEKYGTKLIKTYSFENRENTLLQNLKKRLEEHGVEFRKRTPEELQELIESSIHFEEFMNLVYTFLGLLKSNGKQPHEIIAGSKDKRLKVFLDVFTPLYSEYQRILKKDHALDFNDMVNLAADHITNGRYKKSYKYILVDEFQDMSLGRYELLKCLRKQNPMAKLYAVGDDWQSIFRFSGSDISIITQFTKHFGYTSHSAILTTYRFNDEILKTSSKFIQQNPTQIKKTLAAITVAQRASFVYHPLELEGQTRTRRIAIRHQCVYNILNEIGTIQQNATVFLIGRYHGNCPPALPQLKLDFPLLNIVFYTAHSVKGLTADFAILLDVDAGTYGFPSEIADDPILNAVLHEGDKFVNAEERRLFYVAVTRARHRNYVVFDQTKPSKFVEELMNASPVITKPVKCPECRGNMVKRRGEYSEFYGCTNYPRCTGKLPLTT